MRALLESLLLPPGLLILLIVLGILLHKGGRTRGGITLVGLGVLLLLLLSEGPVAGLLIRPLEERYPAFAEGSGGAEAVVVLTGGVVGSSPETGAVGSPSEGYYKRLLYGAALARRLDLPLVVSGGLPLRNHLSEAAVGERTLDALGFLPKQVVLEEQSRDTWENAEGVRATIRERTVVLVTSAYHMPRAVLAFHRQGFTVDAAPTDYLAYRGPLGIGSVLPSAAALSIAEIALHEYLGLLDYRLRR